MIDTCKATAYYLQENSARSYYSKYVISVALLVPFRDPIVKDFAHHRVLSFEGSEDDVLSRYVRMADQLDPDYIVRVTGDCPLLPDALIGKAINVATKNKCDYASNVDEHIRTAVDGFDIEVMSRRALKWVNENAKEPKEREHVTLALRSGRIPADFKVGHIIGYIDQSNLKLSIDTEEDLERVRAHYEIRERAKAKAVEMHGSYCVHRY